MAWYINGKRLNLPSGAYPLQIGGGLEWREIDGIHTGKDQGKADSGKA
jgi:hypothetical protein